jgi:hypothetical protein
MIIVGIDNNLSSFRTVLFRNIAAHYHEMPCQHRKNFYPCFIPLFLAIHHHPPWTSRLWAIFKRYFQHLNFFPSIPTSTDEHDLRTQRISTRLFIFLFIAAIIILLTYSSLIEIRKTANIPHPTFEQYQQLQSTYSQTLSCPCSQISIKYNGFIDIGYTFHEVCTSVFVEEKWITYLTAPIQGTSNTIDFKNSGSLSFQALRTFCELIDRTVAASITEFYSSQYFSASVTPSHVFRPEIDALITQFRSSMRSSFSLSRSIIRDTTHANALLSGLGANYRLYVVDIEDNLLTDPNTFMGCSCASSPSCVQPSSAAGNSILPISFTVPGFYTGCFVIEALLQSTLECFYEQQCIDTLKMYFWWSSPMNTTALNSYLSKEYSVNSTIGQLVDNLMMETWSPSVMYENYYDACRPAGCSYSYSTRNDLIYIVTTLLGIVGGLGRVLRFIVPRLVKLITRCIRKRRERVARTLVVIET